MKRSYLFALVAIITSFIACNDAEEVLSNDSEIKLTSEITPTSRVTSLEYQSTQLVQGQQVGVTIKNAKSTHNNIAWTAGADGTLTNTGETVYYGKQAADITAYHPYNAEWAGTSHAFSVNTDQSTNEGYLASDLLWATASATKTESPVALTFTHKLAKINVTLQSTDITDLSDATISICGTNIATNFNPATGDLSAATTANVQDIKAGVTTTGVLTASAIVVPQTVSSGTKLIKVSHGSKTFYYTLTANKELKSGYSHNYTLTVKEKEIELKLKSENIIDWNDEENINGDALENSKIVIPNNQIWYTSTDGNIITPRKINVFGSNIISNEYEDGKGIITFDGDVTMIGDYAFNECSSITSITIPNSTTTIGRQAIDGCTSLTSIIIPKNVTTIIGESLCGDCESLASIIVEEGNSVYDSRENCNAIIETASNKLISGCKNTVIPNNVTRIGFSAFGYCSALTNITIPNSVTTIDEFAFWGCSSLTNITIPNSVTKISGVGTFGYCESLASIVVEEGNSVYDSRENCNAIIETSSNKLIIGCKNTVIPNNVTSIGYMAFEDCSSLANITIPNSVMSIEESAFRHCI